jgi:U3 small nucleolar ribonucleoprotein protein LCP5
MAELQRMNEFEEDNMTRLVMTKRDLKRREEDEAALNMGYGVGGPSRSRSRRQGLGRRDGILERSRKRTGAGDGDGMDSGFTKRKKGKFEHAIKSKNRK